MPILYSVISRGTTVLAKYAACAGNFAEVTETVMGKIPPDNSKMTYTYGSYLFHYICEDRIIYMCITDDEFARNGAFLYLDEVKRRFQTAYGSRAETAIAYSMNDEFAQTLASEMKYYSNSRVDNISRVHGELADVKEIMVKNIDSISERGERLELLVKKTDDLSQGSVSFRKTSRNLARVMFWKNVKLYVIVAAVALVIIYLIVSMSCGGLAWKNCV